MVSCRYYRGYRTPGPYGTGLAAPGPDGTGLATPGPDGAGLATPGPDGTGLATPGPDGSGFALRVAALLFLLVGPSLCWAVNPLTFVMPSPGDVIKLIDALTKKDSATSVDVKKGTTSTQGKLLIARTKVDVTLERSSRNWRGRVFVEMTVPTEISYSIDLLEIRPEHITLDTANRLVIVAMPKPKVEAVTPLLSSVTVENKYKRARFRMLDKQITRELQTTMLTQDYQARARKAGEANIAQVREQGREVLQKFLQRLLRGTNPGVHVMVD